MADDELTAEANGYIEARAALEMDRAEFRKYLHAMAEQVAATFGPVPRSVTVVYDERDILLREIIGG